MTIRLKDKELQKKLDELTAGNFSKKLNSELEHLDLLTEPGLKYRVCFGAPPDFLINRFSAVFRADEIEEREEFRLDGWNHWPETEPPELELMQIVKDGHKNNECEFLFFLNGNWCYAMGCTCVELSTSRFKFRPAKLYFEERKLNGVF